MTRQLRGWKHYCAVGPVRSLFTNGLQTTRPSTASLSCGFGTFQRHNKWNVLKRCQEGMKSMLFLCRRPTEAGTQRVAHWGPSVGGRWASGWGAVGQHGSAGLRERSQGGTSGLRVPALHPTPRPASGVCTVSAPGSAGLGQARGPAQTDGVELTSGTACSPGKSPPGHQGRPVNGQLHATPRQARSVGRDWRGRT